METILHKPSNKEDLREIIKKHFRKRHYDLNDIDTSLITDMSCLFMDAKTSFDVSKWNTKNVVNMRHMFYRNIHFNCDISGWDVSNVMDMEGMFVGCCRFDQDISRWNIGRIENTIRMFYRCFKFNQDLSSWNMRKSCHNMFYNCPIKEEYKPKYYNLYGKL